MNLLPLYSIRVANFTQSLKTRLTVKITNIICAPPALPISTIRVTAFREL
jgi:hypothetical protein